MRKLLTMLFVISVYLSHAQIAIFQDADGESGIKLADQSEVIVSAGEASVSYGYSNYISTSRQGFGFNFQFEGANGVASVIEDGVFNPKGTFGGFYLTSIGKSDSAPSKFLFMPYVNTTLSTAKSLDPEALALGTSSRNVFNYEVGVSLSNTSTLFQSKKSVIWGVTANFGKLTDLKSINPATFKQTIEVEGTGFFREREITGYDVEEYKAIDGLQFWNVNLDYALYLLNKKEKNSIILAFHYRHRSIGGNDVGKSGIGLYLGQKDNPGNIVGGFNILYNDLYGTLDNFTNNYDQLSLNVVVGFKVGSNE